MKNNKKQMMYKLQYFQSGEYLYGADFNNTPKIEYINIKQISSFSDIKVLVKEEYAMVRMMNGDKFYIDINNLTKLKKFLNCI